MTADSTNPTPTEFQAARLEMVKTQLYQRKITNRAVLEAMARIPREIFVPQAYQAQAYDDRPLPIGFGQTISQPYMVGFALQALQLSQPNTATVLEIGAGSGYQAALLGQLAAEVYAIERIEALAVAAQQRLNALKFENVRVTVGDGSAGWPAHAPYDGIVVAAAAPDVPRTLLEQLKPGASLVIPIGKARKQELLRLTASDHGFIREVLAPVAFVPLVGRHGWRDREQFS